MLPAAMPRTVSRRSSYAETRTGRCTRDAIRTVAARAFADRGYHRTSLHEVAEDVGIQKASIFHYFASKEALYRAVIDEGHGQTDAIIRQVLAGEGDWMARARAMLDAYVDLVSANPEQAKILLRQSLGDMPEGYDGNANSDRLLTSVTGFLADGQRAGAFAPIDAQSLVLGIMGMVVFFFTSAPVVAPGWNANLKPEQWVEHVRRHVAAIVERVLAGGDVALGTTPPDRRDARDG